jgi:DNA invertase Pin-like site-specific DNA recombinase
MKLVGYVRVSTKGQAEDGLGLAVQEKTIRAWVRANHHRLLRMFRDEGVSGSNGVEEREALPEALNLIASGQAGGLVVARLDRLARNLTVQEAILARVWAAGGQVFAADLGEVARDDPDDPMRTALRQMVGVFSQLERSMITARLRAGRRLKADRGGFAGFGSPPFGYRAVGGDLVPDEVEQEALALIRSLHSEGRSLRGIADTLEASGYRPRRGERWHPESVRRIVVRTEKLARTEAARTEATCVPNPLAT